MTTPDTLYETLSESWLSDNIFEVVEAISNQSETWQEAFAAWLNYTSNDLSSENIEDLISSFEDDYQGEYKDEKDYAYEVIESCYDLPEFAKMYFDYDLFARDLFMGDYWYENGFVFRVS